MDKLSRTLGLFFSICGIIGGILLVVAAFLEDAFPRPLMLTAAVCVFLNSIGIILNLQRVHKNQAANNTQDN